MIVPPSGVRVWLATGATDMRRGMNSFALQVQESLHRDPHVGDRPVENSLARRLGDVLKRLERGKFIWPSPADVLFPSQPRSWE